MKRYNQEHDKLQRFFVVGAQEPSAVRNSARQISGETIHLQRSKGIARPDGKQQGAVLDLPGQRKSNVTAPTLYLYGTLTMRSGTEDLKTRMAVHGHNHFALLFEISPEE